MDTMPTTCADVAEPDVGEERRLHTTALEGARDMVPMLLSVLPRNSNRGGSRRGGADARRAFGLAVAPLSQTDRIF